MSAIPRKRRKSENIKKCSTLFFNFVQERKYDKAGLTTFFCVLQEFGKEGIMDALSDANSFLKRKEMRRGI